MDVLSLINKKVKNPANEVAWEPELSKSRKLTAS